MRALTFVRPLTDDEREQVKTGLRSSDAFTLRRCQIVLASFRGETAPAIARNLACDKQTVLNALHAFNQHGVAALARGPSRPKHTRDAFTEEGREHLKAVLHRSPREFGCQTSVWTLALLAAVSFEKGLTARRVSIETIRITLGRLGIRWRRAKAWITSPDPGYARKKGAVTG